MPAKIFLGMMLIGAVALTACLADVQQPAQVADAFPTIIVDTTAPSSTSTPATQSPTPKPGAEWDGEWLIHVAGNENEWDGTASFEVNGLEVTGSFDLYDPNQPGLHYTFIGEFTEGYLQASGSWQLIGPTLGGTDDFIWQLVPNRPFQFVGNLDTGKFAFCGWRAGSSRPSPCKWP
jgi:hypothetical protein